MNFRLGCLAYILGVKVQQFTPQLPPKLVRSSDQPGHDKKTDKVQLGADLSHLAAAGLYRASHHVSSGKARATLAVLGQQGEGVSSALLRGGAAALSGGVAVVSTLHGVELLRSKSPVSKAEGLNHLLLAGGSGLVAAHLASGQPGVSSWGSKLMLAHGLGEVAVGTYKSLQPGSHERTRALLQVAHGTCLVAAELFHGAAVPLCAAMLGITALQMSLPDGKE